MSHDPNIPRLSCPGCARELHFDASARPASWRCGACSFTASGDRNYADLLGDSGTQTSDHYTLQWGPQLGFLEFLKRRPRAKGSLAAAGLGWHDLFALICDIASRGPVSVYDAACGFGGIADELLSGDSSDRIQYVGADIHASLPSIFDTLPRLRERGLLLRWDISQPLPTSQLFDFVICRAAIHHTPDPQKTFESLCSAVKPGGRIAISAYRRKSITREANDDALRSIVTKADRDEAFAACRQFTVLGKALQQVTEKVHLPEAVPLLGLGAGDVSVHELVYYHLLKCFYNEEFGDEYSTLVNFDWYHPEFAYRYDRAELEQWFHHSGLRIVTAMSSKVQHYLVGQRPE